jgi:hypothetical protein
VGVPSAVGTRSGPSVTLHRHDKRSIDGEENHPAPGQRQARVQALMRRRDEVNGLPSVHPGCFPID